MKHEPGSHVIEFVDPPELAQVGEDGEAPRGLEFSRHPRLGEFIGIFPDVFSKEECDRVIAFFERSSELTYKGGTGGGYQPNVKDSIDLQIMPAEGHPIVHGMGWVEEAEEHRWIFDTLSERVYNCCGDYWENQIWNLGVKETDTLKGPSNIINEAVGFTSWQIQKYPKGSKGYPGIHCEGDMHETRHRLLAPLIYLNDIEEGGETEVHLARLKIRPRAGTVVILPAMPPFYHCGHPAVNQDKYVVTSWMEWLSVEEVSRSARREVMAFHKKENEEEERKEQERLRNEEEKKDDNSPRFNQTLAPHGDVRDESFSAKTDRGKNYEI